MPGKTVSAEEIAHTIYLRGRSVAGRYDIRPAVRRDSGFVYELSMDPRIRMNSTRQDEFSREEHERWWADKLAHPERCRVWIMEVGGKPVGQARYGKVGTERQAEIAISVVPHEWRRGYGLTLLRETMPLARDLLEVDTLVALVLRTNPGSRRLFRRAGFAYTGMERRMGKIHARYEWTSSGSA